MFVGMVQEFIFLLQVCVLQFILYIFKQFIILIYTNIYPSLFEDEIKKIWGTKFLIEQNAVDRRLIVNRHRKLQMYRIWLQGKFRKLPNL